MFSCEIKNVCRNREQDGRKKMRK